MYQSIITEVDGAIGILTLNKADRHNALDQRLIDELTHGLLTLDSDPQARVIVISAAGKSYCAGTDINWMKRAVTNSADENLGDWPTLGPTGLVTLGRGSRWEGPHSGTMLTSLGARTITLRMPRPARVRTTPGAATASASSSSTLISGSTWRRSRTTRREAEAYSQPMPSLSRSRCGP